MTDTVLIVDDEPELREILAFDFESAGFAVATAANANLALDIIKSQPIKAVVSDIRMANGDGIQLLKSLQPTKVAQGPVLFLITGYSDFSIQDALDQGADGFFLKPFSRRNLVGAVQQQLLKEEERWITAPTTAPKGTPHVVKLEFESFDTAVTTRKLNLGRGGLFIACEAQGMKSEDPIKLQLGFKDAPAHVIRGDAVIKWVRREIAAGLEFGIGVEFMKLDEESRLFVRALQLKNKSLAYIPKN